MSNSQTIQENNERINAIVELLKTKSAGEPVDLTEIENAIAELFGETTNLHNTLNTRVENVYFIDNGYKANPAEEYTDTNAVLWAANVVLRPGDYLINKHLYKYIVDTVEHTETGFTFTYHFVESLVPDLYLETANLWNKYTALNEKIPTNYGASLSLTIDSSTYVVTAQLKDPTGNNLGAAQTIDLPLESVVVSGGYDESTKEVVLTLKDNSVIRFSIGDLIDGLVSSGELANYYTKSEADGKIPTKTSQLNNDSGFLTEHQSLADYYTKGEVSVLINNVSLIIQPTNDNDPVKIGARITTAGDYSTLVGTNASSMSYGTTVGNLSSAGNYGVTVGRDAHSANYGVAVGYGAMGNGGVAVGYNSAGYNANSVAVGKTAKSNANGAIQIGNGTNSTENSVQFAGDNVYNTSTHTLTVQNAQVGGSDVVTKANFTLDGTTLTITI